jgi:hypothetical protein
MSVSAQRFSVQGNGSHKPNRTHSTIISVTVDDTDASSLEGRLTELTRIYVRCTIVAFPFARVGSCPRLNAAQSFCPADGPFQFMLPRELSPFLATSEIGLISPRQCAATKLFADRLRAAFGGNFQFLDLLRTVTELATRLTANEHSAAGRYADKSLSANNYDRLIERVRSVACEHLPANANVLVVSKGDVALLDLDRRHAEHFPQSTDGEYAGHHPADAAAAVAQLRALRARGANYLLIPACYLWWIEYYREFRRYLEKYGRVVTCRPDVCIIYELRKSSSDRSSAPARKRSKARRANRL